MFNALYNTSNIFVYYVKLHSVSCFVYLRVRTVDNNALADLPLTVQFWGKCSGPILATRGMPRLASRRLRHWFAMIMMRLSC